MKRSILALRPSTCLEHLPAVWKHETTVILEPVDVSFARYEGFVFGNESIYLPRTEVAALADALDDSGEYHFSVTVPKLEGVPGALRLRTDTKVYESGGRFVPRGETDSRGNVPQLCGNQIRGRS